MARENTSIYDFGRLTAEYGTGLYGTWLVIRYDGGEKSFFDVEPANIVELGKRLVQIGEAALAAKPDTTPAPF